MRSLRMVEFAAGWLSVITGVAVLLFSYTGGFIAPESIRQDVIGFSVILFVLAVGVTLEVATSSRAARLLLGAGALAMMVVAALSFVTYLLPSGALAFVAAVIAFARHNSGSPANA